MWLNMCGWIFVAEWLDMRVYVTTSFTICLIGRPDNMAIISYLAGIWNDGNPAGAIYDIENSNNMRL